MVCIGQDLILVNMYTFFIYFSHYNIGSVCIFFVMCFYDKLYYLYIR